MPLTRLVLCFALTLGCAFAAWDARAQAMREGTADLVDWPASDGHEAPLGDYDVLPFIDTLRVVYRYGVAAEQPEMTVALSWHPGRYGILKGRQVAYRQLPGDLRMVAAGLRADVYVGGERVSELVVSVDSMQLGAYPDVAHVPLAGLAWEDVFPGVASDEARRFFAEGFELRDLGLLEAAFATDEALPAAGRKRSYSRRHSPRTVVIYDADPMVDVFIDLAWLIGRDRLHDRPPGEVAPRDGRIGRGSLASGDRDGTRRRRTTGGRDVQDTRRDDESGRTTTREGRSTRGDDGNRDRDEAEDEKDDDNDLLPAAVTAAAAVGAIAYAGGTVGYFGSVDEAPLGLSAGFVRAGGGVLLQAAVNEALVTSDAAPRHLLVKLLGFRDVFGMPIQPAAGIGVLAVEDGDEVSLHPSLSLGAAGNFGPLLVHAGYDVTRRGVEVGLAFNFRARPQRP